jgi:hypothetical protein
MSGCTTSSLSSSAQLHRGSLISLWNKKLKDCTVQNFNVNFFLDSVFVRRQCFKHLSLIKFFKLFKTLHVTALIGHPQVLKLFVKRIAL